jgi:hypothetical protein
MAEKDTQHQNFKDHNLNSQFIRPSYLIQMNPLKKKKTDIPQNAPLQAANFIPNSALLFFPKS